MTDKTLIPTSLVRVGRGPDAISTAPKKDIGSPRLPYQGTTTSYLPVDKYHTTPSKPGPNEPNATLRIVQGDVTEPKGSGVIIIPHICNNIGLFNAGVAKAIANKWPEAKKD